MTKADSIGSSGALLLDAYFLDAFGLFELRGPSLSDLNLIGVITAFTPVWLIGSAPLVVLEGL